MIGTPVAVKAFGMPSGSMSCRVKDLTPALPVLAVRGRTPHQL